MPTYDYRCKDCGHHLEEFQSVTDEPLTTCPKCGGNLQRLITGGSGLIFKGSGFYITDYKNGKSKSNISSDTKKSDDSQKTGESKSTDKSSD
jgi:putative FmdB family regulatory protein